MRLAKSMRLVMGATLLALLSVWTLNTVSSTFAWGRPTDLDMTGVRCDGVNCQSYEPNIVGSTNFVHLVYINNLNQSLYYHRGRTDGSGNVAWERGKVIATSVKNSDDGVDMVVDAANTIHLAYSSGKTVYYMRAPNEGANGWTGAEKVESPGDRLNNLDIALDGDGNPYIAWAQGINPSYLGYAYRRSGGNWTTDQIGDTRQFLHKNPKIVVHGAGATATIHIFAETERKQNGDFYVIYVRGTPGGNLSVANWSYAFSSPDESDNSPYAAYDPVTGHIYAGYVDRTSGGRFVWAFSRSTDNGSTWEDLRNVSFGSSFWSGLSPMVAYNNTLYIMHSVKEIDAGTIKKIGIYDIRFNAQTNSFSEFRPILNYSDSNHQVPTNENGLSYGFSSNTKVAIWIRNWTNGPGYNADPGGIQQAVNPKATLKINNGAGSTNNKNLNISMTDVIGDPDQMRVAINKPLDNVQPEPFQANFTREATDQVGCVSTVRVELINTGKSLRSEPLEAKIIVDSEVSASTYIGNPYKLTNSRVYSSIQQTGPAVDNGDANYTRIQQFYIQIGDAGECGSLSSFRFGSSENSLSSEFGIVKNTFTNILALPLPIMTGPNTVTLQLKDNVGNVKNIKHTIIYDPDKPKLATVGSVTATAGPADATVMTKLDFAGNKVTDGYYPGRAFWGVLIANSRVQVGDPLTSQSLNWSVVQAPGSSSDFTINNWSVLSGIPSASQTPGDYYIYVRFVDGAGNVSDEYIQTTVSLDAVTKPKTHLPLVRK